MLLSPIHADIQGSLGLAYSSSKVRARAFHQDRDTYRWAQVLYLVSFYLSK
jgi:hypothetical protein